MSCRTVRPGFATIMKTGIYRFLLIVFSFLALIAASDAASRLRDALNGGWWQLTGCLMLTIGFLLLPVAAVPLCMGRRSGIVLCVVCAILVLSYWFAARLLQTRMTRT